MEPAAKRSECLKQLATWFNSNSQGRILIMEEVERHIHCWSSQNCAVCMGSMSNIAYPHLSLLLQLLQATIPVTSAQEERMFTKVGCTECNEWGAIRGTRSAASLSQCYANYWRCYRSYCCNINSTTSWLCFIRNKQLTASFLISQSLFLYLKQYCNANVSENVWLKTCWI